MAQSGRPAKSESMLPGQRGELNVRNAVYPRLLPGNRIEFKIKAPDAKKEQIDIGRIYDLVRIADGDWCGVTDPASESFYGCSMMASGVEIPYREGDVRFYMADVPHGDIRMKRYFSKTSNDWRRMFVYCPPGYDSSTQSYPVLYLQHGGGEEERGWANQGRTDIIMDKLIA